VAFTIHEYAHGFAAYMMGDNTAKHYGRLTLNPIAHIDPLGFLCLIVTQRFGWAKPVPVNDLNFKDRKKGMLVVALAGPMSNFITALLLAVFYGLFYNSLGAVMKEIFQIAYIVNLSIGVFNLIPIPRLDGSKILDVFLTNKQKFFIHLFWQFLNSRLRQ
jgi:Zn-dependent protease